MSSLPVLRCPWPFDSDIGLGRFVVIVALAPDERIVFVRSGEQERHWELPGGRIQHGESVCSAAIREMREETGWELENALEVAIIQNTVGTKVHSQVNVVLGRISEYPAAIPSDVEIAECTLRHSTPQPSTFDSAWFDRVIVVAIQQMHTHENMQLWNRVAHEYERLTYISETVVHYGPLISGEDRLKLLPDLVGTRVLDLGCGAGQNLAALSQSGAIEGEGVDFSREQVDMARTRLRDCAFKIVEADISNYQIEGSFDLVLSVFSIAFVASLELLFKRIYEALLPGGILILSTDHPDRRTVDDPDQKSNWYVPQSRRRQWTMERTTPIPYYHHLHSRAALLGALKTARLEVEAVIEPRALPISEIAAAPYRSAYYLDRYEELRMAPYTMIIKARRLC